MQGECTAPNTECTAFGNIFIKDRCETADFVQAEDIFTGIVLYSDDKCSKGYGMMAGKYNFFVRCGFNFRQFATSTNAMPLPTTSPILFPSAILRAKLSSRPQPLATELLPLVPLTARPAPRKATATSSLSAPSLLLLRQLLVSWLSCFLFWPSKRDLRSNLFVEKLKCVEASWS